jgi:cell volume regulation protein A
VVVISSLLVQGWSLGWLANRLGVALPRRDPPFRRIELDLPGQLEKELVGYRVAPGSAVLRGVEVPAWARLNMVVRDGHVLETAAVGGLRAEDYAYFLAPPDSVERLDWLFAEPGDAREVARDRAGSLRVRADISLRALGRRFHVEVPGDVEPLSLADLFAVHFDDAPHVGDRIEVGVATLEVQALAGERVARVNLILGAPGLLDLALPPGARQGRWRRPKPGP